MSTMNISLPDDLQRFVDERLGHGYDTSDEYVRDLIRRDRDRLTLRTLMLEGLGSGSGGPMDAAYFARLRAARHRA